MRIAETVGMTALLACALLAAAGSITRTSWQAVHVQRAVAPATPNTPRIGRCDVPRQAPRHAAGGAYRDVLIGARESLEACLDGTSDGAEVLLRYEITAAGRVLKLDVKGASDDLTSCLRAVSNGLAFPINEHPVAISAVLRRH